MEFYLNQRPSNADLEDCNSFSQSNTYWFCAESDLYLLCRYCSAALHSLGGFLKHRPYFLPFHSTRHRSPSVCPAMNQDQVRDTYLRVIHNTIESIREEFTESAAGENALESLELLKQRWEARLTQTHDFTEDPEMIDKPSVSAARGGKKSAAKSNKKKGNAKANAKANASSSNSTALSQSSTNPPTRNGGISVADITNDTDEAVQPPLPPVPRFPPAFKPEPQLDDPEIVEVKVVKGGPSDTQGSKTEPPAKRARIERPDPKDDGLVENAAEDLDSSDDSDVAGDESDEEAENLVLAQHEKVKKGHKWKVILKDGIVSIRGREYLFSKATCDLDF